MDKRGEKVGVIKDNVMLPQKEGFTESDVEEIIYLWDPESVHDWIAKHKERLGGSSFEVYEKIRELKKKMAFDDIKKLQRLDEKIERLQAQINEVRAQEELELPKGQWEYVNTDLIRRHEREKADVKHWNEKVIELKKQIKVLKGFWGIPGLLNREKIKKMEEDLRGFEGAIVEKSSSITRDRSVYEMYLGNHEANEKITERQREYQNSLAYKTNKQLIRNLFDEKDVASKERGELFKVIYGHAIFFDPSLLEGEHPDEERILEVITDNTGVMEQQEEQEK